MKTIAAPREKTKTKRILLIDDDPRFCQAVSLKLREAGYRVFLAGDGREGLRQVEKHQPDLILSELKLLGMDGVEFLRRLRKKDERTKVFFVTAYAPEIACVHAKNLQFEGYFEKPFALEDLLREIRKTIGKPAS